MRSACLFVVLAALGCDSARGDAVTVCNVPQLAGGSSGLSSEAVQPSRIQTPPTGKYYHGVYPGGRSGWEDDVTLSDLLAYQEAAWRRVAWVYLSHNWYGTESASPVFPSDTVNWIRDRGAVPFVRLMLTRDENAENHLKSIPKGNFDADLDAWGACAREFRSALLVEWGTEMNGCSFPWSGCENGADEAAVEDFVTAYQYIVDRIRGAGAKNVTWVFHINSTDDPEEPWNSFENYFPEPEYFDWVGLSHYGPQSCCEENNWTGWAEGLKDALKRLEDSKKASKKPVFLLEFGVDGNNSSGEEHEWTAITWTDRALDFLLADSPEHYLSGFAWWNGRFNDPDCNRYCKTDMRVQSVPGLAGGFRDYLAGDDRVVDRPILEPLEEKP